MAEVGGNNVDIDELVDHYLGIPVAARQGSVFSGDNNDDTHPQLIGEDNNKCSELDGNRQDVLTSGGVVDYDDEEEGDIEALVESILRGEPPYDESSLPPPPQREGEEEEKEEMRASQEKHSPPVGIFNADRILHPTRSTSSRRSNAGGVDRREHLLCRLMLWQERRDAKHLQAVYEALLREQAECPFQPRESLARGGSIECDLSNRVEEVNGVDGFLQRMREAREMREQKQRAEDEEARRYADPSTWNPRVTIPRPFHLGIRSRKMTAAAYNHDTFKKYAAQIRLQLQNEPSQIEGPSVPSGLFSVPASALLLSHVPHHASLPQRPV
ncbi:hypothetical protein TcG_05011 [Trypanosoma cruzi]|uniref:Uncharacterized protein n=1 Tax=Trypanosoma cruzi TaxID=5693 RepID=A0A2V2V1N2_TRYCR|nr:hypothetical protein BCY84_20291 [Trypanosoma cruzi cruzi]PWU90260.1 hypothetical protein C4B63_52g67 [Trypanosoma cruzi]RNF18509.1 hypothetical protein TcG_05011 [Trypanosoma cruzi]